jgi:hypothetical protein
MHDYFFRGLPRALLVTAVGLPVPKYGLILSFEIQLELLPNCTKITFFLCLRTLNGPSKCGPVGLLAGRCTNTNLLVSSLPPASAGGGDTVAGI